MALTSLQAKVIAQFQATVSRAGDLSNPQASAQVNRVINFVFGDDAIGEADEIWYERFILADSGTNDHDLIGGGLLNPLGEAISFAKVRGILIINQSDIAWSTHEVDATAVLTIGGDANSLPFLTAAADSFNIHAGDIFMLTRNTAAGITVTAGTGDIIQVVCSASVEALYDIFVIGKT